MIPSYDIAVVGSGYSGSLLAMIAVQLGYSVVLLERGRHPRFVIGESSTPLSNLLLYALATRYALPALRPLTKWGTWQRQYPQVGCGLKRGFSFFHHDFDRAQNLRSENQLLVAASPHDEIGDTHWFRADADAFLVKQAQLAGVHYEDEVRLQRMSEHADGVELLGRRHGRDVCYAARFVFDATGPRGCLHQLLGLQELSLEDYPRTQALYSHFSGVRRLEDTRWNNVNDGCPYPANDAAVHHVFDGGWIWVLQFNNGVTSAGVAAMDAKSSEFRLEEGEPAWQRLIDRFPVLQEQFADSVPVQRFTHLPQVCFRSSQVVGKHWALLPSAAGFVDPLLSTGFALSLLGIERIALLLAKGLGTHSFVAGLEDYASMTDAELLQTGRLIAALYANMQHFEVFRAITLLYFAAASYSETVRLLGRPRLATSFLLQDHETFGTESRGLLAESRSGSVDPQSFLKRVKEVIEPFDVAGLTSSHHDSAYPVDANDLLASAWKVGADKDAIVAMLNRSGFYAAAAV